MSQLVHENLNSSFLNELYHGSSQLSGDYEEQERGYLLTAPEQYLADTPYPVLWVSNGSVSGFAMTKLEVAFGRTVLDSDQPPQPIVAFSREDKKPLQVDVNGGRLLTKGAAGKLALIGSLDTDSWNAYIDDSDLLDEYQDPRVQRLNSGILEAFIEAVHKNTYAPKSKRYRLKRSADFNDAFAHELQPSGPMISLSTLRAVELSLQ